MSDFLRRTIEPLLGLPYRKGAAGPDAFDCWGLCRFVQARLFNRELAEIEAWPEQLEQLAGFVAAHVERKKWRRVEAPLHGCIVEMSHNLIPWHVGVYLQIDGGGVLHAREKRGVVFEDLFRLRRGGFREVYFNEWHA